MFFNFSIIRLTHGGHAISNIIVLVFGNAVHGALDVMCQLWLCAPENCSP